MIKRQPCLRCCGVPTLRAGVRRFQPLLTRRSRPVGGVFIRSLCRASQSTSSFESDGQPTEGSNLSGSFVATLASGKLEQRPKLIRNVTRGPAGDADRMEYSKIEITSADQFHASERLRFVHP